MCPVDSLRTETKFKKTEIGEIPVDWELLRLGDCCEVFGGSTPSTKKTEYWNGDILWAVPTDITKLKGNVIENTEKKITERGLANSAAKLLPAGSILLTSRPTIGECAINSRPMATNQGFANLVCRKDIHNWFLLYRLKLVRKRLENISSGSTFREISKRSIREIRIPLPSFVEQEKIAEILAVADEAVEKKQEIIEKLKELKNGVMQELLTRGIGYTKFKKTEIGEIPAKWQIVQVKDASEKPKYGYTASAIEKPVGPKLLRITDIQNGHVNWSSVPYCSCPDSIKKKYLLKSGDILFARTGATPGKSILIQDCPETIYASYLIRIVPTLKISSKFLNYIFNSHIYWKQIKQILSGSAQGGINATFLSRIKIPLPPMVEQEKVATILSEVDKIIEKELCLKTTLTNMKNGLMEILLTGKIRVSIKRVPFGLR